MPWKVIGKDGGFHTVEDHDGSRMRLSDEHLEVLKGAPDTEFVLHPDGPPKSDYRKKREGGVWVPVKTAEELPVVELLENPRVETKNRIAATSGVEPIVVDLGQKPNEPVKPSAEVKPTETPKPPKSHQSAKPKKV